MGGCLIKTKESEEGDKPRIPDPNVSNTKPFNHQTAKLTPIGLQVQNKYSPARAKDDGEFSPTAEMIYCESSRNAAPFSGWLRASPRSPPGSQSPLQGRSVTYPAHSSQSTGRDEPLVPTPVPNGYPSEMQLEETSMIVPSPVPNGYPSENQLLEETSMSETFEISIISLLEQEVTDSGDDTVVLISENSELTPSIIFSPLGTNEQHLPIPPISVSLQNLERKPLNPKRVRSAPVERSDPMTPAIGTNCIYESQTDYSTPGQVDLSVSSGFDSSFHNSLYSSESELKDKEYIWASFIPRTPTPGRDASTSSYTGTSSQKAQLQLSVIV